MFKIFLRYTVFELSLKQLCLPLCGLLVGLFYLQGGILAAEGESPVISKQKKASMNASTKSIIRYDPENRRDPFRPIPQKGRSISMSPTEPSTVLKVPPSIEDPRWKLLGVIHARFGYQAVIQVSSKERILVGLGEEIARSGWVIRAIDKGHVFLESRSPTSPVRDPSQPRIFTLSFLSF